MTVWTHIFGATAIAVLTSGCVLPLPDFDDDGDAAAATDAPEYVPFHSRNDRKSKSSKKSAASSASDKKAAAPAASNSNDDDDDDDGSGGDDGGSSWESS